MPVRTPLISSFIHPPRAAMISHPAIITINLDSRMLFNRFANTRRCLTNCLSKWGCKRYYIDARLLDDSRVSMDSMITAHVLRSCSPTIRVRQQFVAYLSFLLHAVCEIRNTTTASSGCKIKGGRNVTSFVSLLTLVNVWLKTSISARKK